MDGDSTSTVKSVNSHPLRIDVVKFYGKNNFGMWRCIDGIKSQRHSTVGEKARDYYWKGLGQDEPNGVCLGIVLFDTRYQVSCVI